jgi:hypothetical protein
MDPMEGGLLRQPQLVHAVAERRIVAGLPVRLAGVDLGDVGYQLVPALLLLRGMGGGLAKQS